MIFWVMTVASTSGRSEHADCVRQIPVLINTFLLVSKKEFSGIQAKTDVSSIWMAVLRIRLLLVSSDSAMQMSCWRGMFLGSICMFLHPSLCHGQFYAITKSAKQSIWSIHHYVCRFLLGRTQIGDL